MRNEQTISHEEESTTVTPQPDPTAPPAFTVRDVVYRYNASVTALDGVTLSVPRGQRVAILGANGSGKSTLIRLLDGLYFPTSGTVAFEGTALTEEALQDEAFAFDFRRRVALVFQNPDVQLFCPTVFDEVAFGPLQLRWPKDEIRRKVAAVLEELAISHLKDRPPHRLSGGEKKRVALASVLILDPEVIILDEPTAALDPKSQSQVVDILAAWDGGAKTVITATHDLDVVDAIADWCYVFQTGKLVAEGAPAAILTDDPLLARTNLIHAHRHRHTDGTVHAHPHRHDPDEHHR
ncbi:MAG TPA: ABC transporter ATP-binding protein [Thermomicrobiales bacterium]|jgi:cobalt/nickel transport system ATP-binding protein